MVKTASQLVIGDVVSGPILSPERATTAGQNHGSVAAVESWKRDMVTVTFEDGQKIRRQMDYSFEVRSHHAS